jgi:hypothetical protein
MADRISVTREQYLDSIRQLTASATGLTARFTMTQLTWQPENGERWSILECLDHIAISTALYLDAMQTSVGDARPGALSGIFQTAGLPSTQFTRFQEPPPRRKFPTLGKIRPRPTLNPEGILPQFVQTMERATSMVTASSGKDLNRVRFRNPLVPVLRFTVATGFLIIAAHARRHIWQAEQVTQEPDFPR